MTTKIQAVAPRLSDEDRDPIEEDENDTVTTSITDGAGWLSWDSEDIADVKRIIATRMPENSKKILQAFLNGLTYNDINVTEKFWRWHFNNGLQLLRKEMKCI